MSDIIQDTNTTASKKIISFDRLTSVLQSLKVLNKTTVFTNGCFDILHIGHARYLAQAKSLGDVLIVGVNEDASVKRLKGDSRPINRVGDRMLLLAHLEAVDFVVSFSEDTAINIIEVIKPTFYVKGGDVILDNVPERNTVERLGGKIVIMPCSDGYSSTNIINKINNANR